MDGPLRIVCPTCGHDAVASRTPAPGRCWRCSECGGQGVEASEVDCVDCGMLIPRARRKAMPQTNHCVACAGQAGFAQIRLAEPLGLRDDFKRDRASWRR